MQLRHTAAAPVRCSTRSPVCSRASWPAAAGARRTTPSSTPGARRVRAAAALSNVRQVTEEELEAIVGGSIDTPTVVDFYATWCGPCLLLATELEKVAKELGDKGVQVLKLDVDKSPSMSTRLQIQGLPTMIFISTSPDKPALRTEGLLPAETIKNIIAKEL